MGKTKIFFRAGQVSCVRTSVITSRVTHLSHKFTNVFLLENSFDSGFLLGRLFGEIKSRQASGQLYNDPKEFPLLERAPPLPEDEAVCYPHSGLGSRISCEKVHT